MIDVYDEVDRETPLKGRRWVLGQVSTLTPRDVERIARMGLVVSTHTNRYIYKEGHLLLRGLSPEREEEISPHQFLVGRRGAGLPGDRQTCRSPCFAYLAKPRGETSIPTI